MNITTSTRPLLPRRLVLALVAGLLLLSLGLQAGRAKADNLSSNAAVSYAMGTTFDLNSSGFTPGERVSFWTTDPNGQALDAGYLYADLNGNIMVEMHTSDPSYLAIGSNYSVAGDIVDSNNNSTGEFLRLILKETPAAGSWHLSGYGNTSKTTKVFDFNLTNS